MKFSDAWADTATQNALLKFVVFMTSLATIICALTIFLMSTSPPILIERSCRTNQIAPSTADQTPEEIKTFIELSLLQRFNTANSQNLNYLSKFEKRKRQKELSIFSRQKIDRYIVINEIKTSEDSIIVDTDKILSAKNVRSAFFFPLVIKIKKIKRDQSNPYGIILDRVTPIRKRKTNAKKN